MANDVLLRLSPVLTVSDGTSFVRSVTVVTSFSRSSVPLTAVSDIGTFCWFSDTRRAVTTISSPSVVTVSAVTAVVL